MTGERYVCLDWFLVNVGESHRVGEACPDLKRVRELVFLIIGIWQGDLIDCLEPIDAIDRFLMTEVGCGCCLDSRWEVGGEEHVC